MSFILDALKKSESERQRQTGPALFEVKVAPPRNRFPFWAVFIGVLLVINLGVVAWLLFSGSEKSAPQESIAAANPVAPPAAPQQYTPPAVAPTQAPANAGGYFGSTNVPFQDPRIPSTQSAPPDVEPGSDEPTLKDNVPEEDALNPEDYEPAVEPENAPAPRPAARVAAAEPQEADASSSPPARGARSSGLPTYQDVVAMPGVNVPPLRLDLHVYDPKPDARFVFVNMQKLKQGDSIAQGGVHVDSITPEGAVLSFRGIRFVLARE